MGRVYLLLICDIYSFSYLGNIMHYHVEVGIPAGEVRGYDNYEELMGRIHAEINHIMRKYDDCGENWTEEEMREYGIMPTYTEEDEDGNVYYTWWKEDKNGELIQVNITKEEDAGVEFKIKSWLRNKAIDAVGLEIRSMKKKAYEYSKDELMKMIEEEENKLIKKGGWKAVRVAALSTLGLGWLPFI